MKKILLLAFVFISLSCFSQEDAWVYFKDKPNSQSYFSNPLTMLSQRALDRRTTQNIPLDMKDVPIFQSYIDQISTANGITVKAKSKWLNCVHVRANLSDITSLINLSFVKKIVFANKNIMQLGTNRVSANQNTSAVNKQLDVAVDFNYGNSANQIQMLNGHLLHQQNFTGAGKIIAVFDAGFPNVNTIAPFQRLRTNNQILGGYNFVDKNSTIYTRNGHGTLVLSTMGGFVDNQLVGTAPDAQYYLFITEDVDSENPVEESNWVEAAEMADYLGVDVINSSLGYFDYDNPNYSLTYSDMTGNKNFASQGANIAFSRGMIVVCSAGNSGSSSEPHVGVPAEATNVLAIGAVKADRTLATFSSIGPSFDNRVKPDIMAKGQSTTVSNTSGSVVTANGTSFSGPVMAGMIASFWQAVPNATNVQIVNFVKQASDRFTNPTIQFGYGIPDFQMALTNALNVQQQPVLTTEFSMYPNPVSDFVTVKFPNNYKAVSLNFYNTVGQLVNQIQDLQNNTSINISAFSNGMYFYRFESSEGTIKGKFLKK